MPQLFDSVAVRVRSEDVGGVTSTIGFDLHDIGETWTLGLTHRTLHYRPGLPTDGDVVVRLTRADLIAVVTLDSNFAELVEAGRAELDRGLVDGLPALDAVFANLDTFMTMFPLVEP